MQTYTFHVACSIMPFVLISYLSVYFSTYLERNLNPKAACLKRREEEKTEDLPGRSMHGGVDLAQQAAMASKVCIGSYGTLF